MARLRERSLVAIADRYGMGLFVYGAISVVSALSEWGSFLAAWPFVGAVYAALLGFVVATVLNYILSHYLAFRSARPLAEEFMLVIGMSAVAFAANFLLFYVLYAFAAVTPLHAKILGTCFGFSFNYAVRQFLIFSRIPRFSPVSTAFGRRLYSTGPKDTSAIPTISSCSGTGSPNDQRPAESR